MKILAVDTSTKFLSLGIYAEDKIYEYKLEVGPKLSNLLVPTIQSSLDLIGIDLSDLDYLACGLGPGSFTGMRIGLAAIKGFSWALKIPVVAIPTMDILAQGVKTSRKIILPVIDAKRNLIYASAYNAKNREYKKVFKESLFSIEGLLKKVKGWDLSICGDAIDVYRQQISQAIPDADFLDKDLWYPNPHSLLELALRKIKEKRFVDPLKLDPIYLYQQDCQVRKR